MTEVTSRPPRPILQDVLHDVMKGPRPWAGSHHNDGSEPAGRRGPVEMPRRRDGRTRI